MLNDLYNQKILELAGNIPVTGKLESFDGPSLSGEFFGKSIQHSKLCGSKVRVELKLKSDKVCAYAHDVKACMLGQAACAIMAEHIIGSNFIELNQLRDDVFAMLKHDGAPPVGKWADVAALQPVKDVKARHASTLLVFDAVCDALKNAKGSNLV